MLNETAAAPGSYFVTGGAVPLDAACYVERPADAGLLDNLRRSEFCYVLVCRQMGKSSLMVRTADRLRDEGIISVVLDLNAVGSTMSQEQWYYALITTIARKLAIHSQVKAFWEQSSVLSPWQRWIAALEYILSELFDGRLVIFVDEIDQVLQLKFDTDEFFAGIRSCYSRRSQDPEFNRVTFCLFGVALASDLIENPRITPFNVGNRIGLADFAEKDLRGYAAALQREEILDEVLIERVFYWTNGHPYLTQRLCFEIVNTPEATSPAAVDALCHKLFLSADAQEQDDNIVFIRDRLIRSEEDVTALLNLYADVLRRRASQLAKSDRLLSILLLSGIVRVDDGLPKVRNRIYERVFNPDWVRAHLPGAEQRRMRAAYRAGLLRAWLPAIAIISLVSILGVDLYWQKQQANRTSTRETRLATEADNAKAKMKIFKDAYGSVGALFYRNEFNAYKSLKVLMSTRPENKQDTSAEKDTRGFMFRWLWHENTQDRCFLTDPDDQLIFSAAVSPDGKQIATAGQARQGNDSLVRIWDVARRRIVASLPYPGEVMQLAFSPDGTVLVAGGRRPNSASPLNIVRAWSLPHYTLQPDRPVQDGDFSNLTFGPTGNSFVATSYHSVVTGSLQGGRPVIKKRLPSENTHATAMSADWMAIALDRSTELVSRSSKPNRNLVWHDGTLTKEAPNTMAFSPDGRSLVSGDRAGFVHVWDVDSPSEEPRLTLPHSGSVAAVAFSPGGDMVATACWDKHVRLWDSKTGDLIRDYVGHLGLVNSVAFIRLPAAWDGDSLRSSSSRPPASIDRLFIVSGSNDGTIRFWSADRSRLAPIKLNLHAPVESLAISPDDETLALTSIEDKHRLIGFASLQDVGRMIKCEGQIVAAAYAPPSLGPILAVAYSSGTICFVNAHSLELVRRFEVSKPLAFASDGRYRLNFSSDGRYLVLLGDAVTIWNARSPGRATKVPQKLSTITGAGRLVLSPDGNTMAICGPDKDRKYGNGTVDLWDMHDFMRPQWRGCIHGAHSNDINRMAISPDNLTLATAGWDQTVRLWDINKSKGIRYGNDDHLDNTLRVGQGPIKCIAFTPDSKEIYVGNNDSTISAWDLASRLERGVIGGHTGPVTDLNFVNKDTLISSSEDGTVRYWYATPAGELAGQLDDPVRVEWLEKKLK